MKILLRALVIALLAVVAVGVLAPHVNADRLRPRIQAALEGALNRPVQMGAVRLNLFTGPGFSVKDVLIDDDPAAGVEPFAHVESLTARIRLTSLLAGHLAFSSLHLDSPSVNLVKPAAGPWNIQPLLDRTSHSNTVHLHAVPDIHISDGRLNFKFGDTKSVFYINGADVEIYPNQSGDVVIRFSGAPARSDRGWQTFGQISARGMLRSSPNGEDQLNLGLRMERTAISEVVRLFNARDLGVHGFAIANARLAGPLSRLEVTGDLNINDIHRWDLMPQKGEGWTLNLRGLLNLRAHQLEVETVAAGTQPSPVSFKFRLADYLGTPKWAASFIFRDFPAASLVETARHMGAPLPSGVQVDGKVQGGVSYSNDEGLQGQLQLQHASLKVQPAASAEFELAPVMFSKDNVTFGPASVRMDNGQSAEIAGEYALDNSRAQLRISTRQLTIAEVQSSAERMVSAAPIPVLKELRQGAWKGWIAFDKREDRPGVWSGDYELQNAVMDIPGLSAPLRLTTASVEMKAGAIQINRIRAHVGTVKLEGDYRYDPDAGRPHRVRVTIPELQLSELEHLMMPTLVRHEGFLARTFRLRKEKLPAWLEEREVDGSIEVQSLMNGDALLGEIRTHLVWDGPTILLSNLNCTLDDMHATGKMILNVAQAAPAYHWTGKVEDLDYRNGRLDFEGELDTSGIGENLLLNIRSQGTFEGRDLELATDAPFHEIAGSYRISGVSGIPRLVLTNLQVTQGGDTFTGQGSSQSDGHLILELTSGRRQMRLTGMLLPLHAEPAPAR